MGDGVHGRTAAVAVSKHANRGDDQMTLIPGR
jgi:hypothetical protein